VQFSEGQFTILVGDLSLQMSVFDIESPVFSFCRLARQFVNLLVSAEWIRIGKFVLSQNPSWLNRDKDLYVKNKEKKGPWWVTKGGVCAGSTALWMSNAEGVGGWR
jgi:hypothetical protein